MRSARGSCGRGRIASRGPLALRGRILREGPSDEGNMRCEGPADEGNMRCEGPSDEGELLREGPADEGNMRCEGPSDEGCKQRGSSTFSRLSERLIAQRLIRRIDHDVIDRRAIDPKDKKKEQTEVRS